MDPRPAGRGCGRRQPIVFQTGFAFLLGWLALTGCTSPPPLPPEPTEADFRAAAPAARTAPAVLAKRFEARPGSKVRIEGTSSLHAWQVESKLVGGYLEAASTFPDQLGQPVAPGRVEARGEVFIPVRSLISLEKDGSRYSTAMEDIMYEKLKAQDFPRILYRLSELVLKETVQVADAPYFFEAKGDLVVAGVTRQISMPVTVRPSGAQELTISGSVSVRMTDFNIEPPAPKLALGLIKTADEVKLVFEWRVVRRPATSPASN